MFKLDGIINPSDSTPTSSFEIYTFADTSLSNAIDELTSGLTISATGGSLSSVFIYPLDYTGVLEYATEYYVSFIIENVLESGASVYLEFPTEFTVDTTTSCSISPEFSSATSCAASSDTN